MKHWLAAVLCPLLSRRSSLEELESPLSIAFALAFAIVSITKVVWLIRPSLLVRDVEAVVPEKLKQWVRKNGRSLQVEIRRIITKSVEYDRFSAIETAMCIKEAFGVGEFSDSVDPIREDRNR